MNRFKWVLVLMSILVCCRAGVPTANKQDREYMHLDLPEKPFPKSTTLEELTNKYKEFMDGVLKQVLPTLLKATNSAGLSGRCTQALYQSVIGVRQLKEWAVSMVDATGKLQSGIFDGTWAEFGDYDECLSIRANREDQYGKLQELFTGKYCLVQLEPPYVFRLPPGHRLWKVQNATIFQEIQESNTVFQKLLRLRDGVRLPGIRLGACIPSVCTQEDVRRALQMLFQSLEFEVKIIHCETQKAAEWGSEHVGFITILGILLSLVLMGTVMDILFRKKDTKRTFKATKQDCCSNFWQALSIRTSVNSLLVIKEDRFSCMAGIRTITIIWIVLANTYFFPHVGFFFRFKRLLSSLTFQDDFFYGLLANCTPAIDSLFVMSGILIAYESGRRLATYGEDPKLWTGFLRRFLRMFPAMVFTIWLFILFPLMGDGPQWEDLVNKNVNVCRKTWWRSMIFIQNFWDYRESCMMHTWFLALLVQYSFLSAILIWMLFRKPILGLLTTVCCIVGSSLALGYFNVDNRFPPTLSLAAADVDLYVEFMNKDFVRTYSHLGSFCVGLLFGFMLIKRAKISIHKIVQWIGWTLSLFTFMAVIYGLYRFPYTGDTYTTMAAIYSSVHRVVWAIAVGWICLVCSTGHGGIMNRFLSWKVFVQVDRLFYFVYLLHPLVIFFFAGRARERVFLGHPEMVLNFLGILTLTVILSFLCYVLFQRPLKYLDTFMFARRMRIRNKSEDEEKKLPDPEAIINMYRSDSRISDCRTSQNGEASGIQQEMYRRRKRSSSVMFREEPEILSKEAISGRRESAPRERKKSILTNSSTVFQQETIGETDTDPQGENEFNSRSGSSKTGSCSLEIREESEGEEREQGESVEMNDFSKRDSPEHERSVVSTPESTFEDSKVHEGQEALKERRVPSPNSTSS